MEKYAPKLQNKVQADVLSAQQPHVSVQNWPVPMIVAYY